MQITHLNPETMHRNPAFSQGILVEQPGRLLIVGGQNGIDRDGKLAGDDLASQTRQALRNVLEVLQAAGATQQNVLKLTIFMVFGQSVEAGYRASAEVWGPNPTAISVLFVTGLGIPGALVEIEALAALP